MRIAVRFIFLACVVALPASAAFAAGVVTWISSTADQPWRRMPDPTLGQASPEAPPQIRVVPEKGFQTIDGFGGCFNELGWVALAKASEADRRQVLAALFGDDGCAFTLARIPIGASDFAVDAYSLDDTPGDLGLKNFSLARDEKQLLPFIRAAMTVRPALRCWASAWSPPAWMKTNQNYSKGSLRWEPAVLRAYANYLAHWVDAYRLAGINVYALTPQNEPNILSAYPSCLWTGPQLREFIADYLGPQLRDGKPGVELWLGLNGDPPNDGDNFNDRLATVLDDPAANRFLAGVAFQYDSRRQIGVAHEAYPDKKLMQSETECRNGDNSWGDAQRLYALMQRYLDGGASAYFAWNMVLDETGLSTWKWRQNALVSVDHGNGKVTYHGEYYVMRHFSQYVKPGAKRVLTTGPWGDKIAFVNADGSTVLVVGNSAKQPQAITLAVAGRNHGGTFKATLPPESVSTFVVERE